jgi:hypothetical protein
VTWGVPGVPSNEGFWKVITCENMLPEKKKDSMIKRSMFFFIGKFL